MAVLDEIRKPVENEMKQFESFFYATMKSNIPFLRIILNYVIRRKGKQMRPMLVLLSAGINGKITESTYVAATMIELLHTASLVHDDVVDSADERRGAPSINALWNSKIAVLLGDYMLTKGLMVSVQSKRYDMLEIICESVKSMTEGELMQIQKVRKYRISEEDYFKIITGKTAALISACTATGTKSATDDSNALITMKEVGLNIGIAFQIRDDLLDYSNDGFTGKKSCNDIKEGKLTLPLIHALCNATLLEHRKIISIIKNKKKSDKDITTVVNFVKSNGGLEYAGEMMAKYTQNALNLLAPYPNSEYKTAFIDFINFTTARNK